MTKLCPSLLSPIRWIKMNHFFHCCLSIFRPAFFTILLPLPPALSYCLWWTKVQTYSNYNLSPMFPPLPSICSPASRRKPTCPSPHSNSDSIHFSSSSSLDDSNNQNCSQEHLDFVLIPDPPTNCCMSGCTNCVWITYAQDLAVIYKNGGKAAEEVLNSIEDPSLKIFLSFELKEALKETEEH